MNSESRSLHILYVTVILLLFILCYHSTLAWMLQRWGGIDSYYSHGYLVPFISAYLIWLKREDLKKKQLTYSPAGLILVLFAILLHVMGTVLYIFSLSGFSMFLFIIGGVLFILGRDITRTISFPLLFLVFMFPLPLAVLSAVSFPLKLLVAKTGVMITQLVGIPVIREGFDLTIPGGNMVVGNPCSGLRSLVAFLALGAVMAYLTDTSFLKRIIIFLSAIPIAILSNVIRVPGLILIAHYGGMKAAAPESILHTLTGMLVFVLGFILLLLFSRTMQWKN